MCCKCWSNLIYWLLTEAIRPFEGRTPSIAFLFPFVQLFIRSAFCSSLEESFQNCFILLVNFSIFNWCNGPPLSAILNRYHFDFLNFSYIHFFLAKIPAKLLPKQKTKDFHRKGEILHFSTLHLFDFFQFIVPLEFLFKFPRFYSLRFIKQTNEMASNGSKTVSVFIEFASYNSVCLNNSPENNFKAVANC